MEALLLRLARLTPIQLTVRAWLLTIAGALVAKVKPLEGVGAAIVFAVGVGYPYAIALGLSSHPSDRGMVRLARTLFVVFAAFLLFVSVAVPLTIRPAHNEPVSASSASFLLVPLIALIGNVVVFGPYFLASRALNEARRRAGRYVRLDNVPTFLGMLFGLYGGYFYVHKLVRETLGIQEP